MRKPRDINATLRALQDKQRSLKRITPYRDQQQRSFGLNALTPTSTHELGYRVAAPTSATSSSSVASCRSPTDPNASPLLIPKTNTCHPRRVARDQPDARQPQRCCQCGQAHRALARCRLRGPARHPSRGGWRRTCSPWFSLTRAMLRSGPHILTGARLPLTFHRD
jgi:hypothetical protein